jgi:hypothetical protein
MTQNWAIETLVAEEIYTDRQEFLDYLGCYMRKHTLR